MQSQSHPRRLARAVLAGSALIVLVIAGLWLWRLAGQARALAAAVTRAEAAGADPAAWPELCAAAAAADGAAADLRASLGPLLPLAPRLAPLPAYGPELAAAGPALAAAADLGDAAALICAELEHITAPLPEGRPAAPALTGRLGAARPGLAAARASLDAAAARLAEAPRAGLRPALAERLARAEGLLARAGAALDLAVVAPALLGADGPRTYLVVVQNPDELRPTGGFMSAAGLVQVEGGRPTSIDIRDSNLVDSPSAAYPLAPEPMRRYMLDRPMGAALWEFRDANWSPDFPEAARQMLDLYALGQSRRADGVLAVTPDAVRLALGALGPVQIEGVSRPVDAANVEQSLRTAYDDAVEQGRAEDRKSFVNRLASAMLRRVEGEDAAGLLALAQASERALDTRAAQLYLVEDGPAAAFLAARGWDGAVRPGGQDFLMAVSANVGYNKVGPSIAEQIRYAVDLSDESPSGAVTVAYANGSAGGPGCVPLPGGRAYAELTQGCYWNYLRVLAPGGAALADTEVPVVPDSWVLGGSGDDGRVYSERGPAGTRSYGALVVVPRASSSAVTFRYDLPPEVVRAEGGLSVYRLRLQRQPGLTQRAEVRVLLPGGADLLAAEPAPVSRSGQIYTFELPLATDRALELRYRAP